MLRRRLRVVTASAGALATLLAGAIVPEVRAASPPASATLTAPCLDPTVGLSVEERRLTFVLPDNANPSVLQTTPFARQMIDGAGFQDFGPAFVGELCHTPGLRAGQMLARQSGERLWRRAVDRAQRRGPVQGSLPYSDDRPLYWTRLQATAALRQWKPPFPLSGDERSTLITTFDRASRGMFDIDFPAGSGVERLLTSGFDPYTLDGGQTGPAPGSAGNNIRHGNPSGATALSVDGTRYRTPSGNLVLIEAYTLPVNYDEFQRGYLEDTVGPFLQPGPRQVNASVTVSQAGPDQFNLEMWNGRYHGVTIGNDNLAPCPAVNGQPQLAVQNHDCDTSVVSRWGGPPQFDLRNPPQWTETTLPVAAMIAANTGASVPRPPGDTWPDLSTAFGVVWHTNYTEFPDCSSTPRVTRNNPPPTTYPPPTPPTPPDPGSCAYSGGGGNYLSNESAYRNTLLRDRLGLHIPAGHIHTPNMQHFDAGNEFNPSDSTFDAWRRAIVAQAQNLLNAVADNA